MNTEILAVPEKTKYSFLFVVFGIAASFGVPILILGNGFAISFVGIMSVFLLVFTLVTKRELTFFKYFDKCILAYIFIIIFSFFNFFISQRTIGFLITNYTHGLISFFIVFTTYVVVIENPDRKNAIVKGLLIGLVLNLVYGAYQYIGLEHGWAHTDLSAFFPNYDVELGHLTMTRRVKGAFLEPSSFMKFLVPTLIFVVTQMKQGVFKVVVVVATISIMALTLSPLFILGIIGFLLYYFILLTAKKRAARPKGVTYAMLLRFSLYAAVIFLFIAFNLWEWLNEHIDFVRIYERIFTGAAHGEYDGGRGEFLRHGLSILPNYFLGAGFNATPTIMTQYFGRGSSFNAFVNIALSTGILGVIAYTAIYVYPAYKLIKHGASKYSLALGIALICALIANSSTGVDFMYSTLVLLGLASIEIVDSINKESCEAVVCDAEPKEVVN